MPSPRPSMREPPEGNIPATGGQRDSFSLPYRVPQIPSLLPGEIFSFFTIWGEIKNKNNLDHTFSSAIETPIE